MKHPSLAIPNGTSLRLRGALWIVVGAGVGGRIKLRGAERNQCRYIERDELQKKFEQKMAWFESGPEAYDAANDDSKTVAGEEEVDIGSLTFIDQVRAQRRHVYLTHLHSAGVETYSHKSLQEALKKAHAELKGTWDHETGWQALKPKAFERLKAELARIPSWRTVAKWAQVSKAYGLKTAAFFGGHGGNKTPRLSQTVEQAMQEVIETKYLIPTAPSMSSAYRFLEARIAKDNELRPESAKLVLPSFKAFSRRINALDRFDVLKARHGEEYARKATKAYGIGPIATRALERVEIDHHLLDVYVTFARGKVVLGRPWLTLMIDKCTRMIVGYYISFDPPSYLTVMRCLLNALCPKVFPKSAYGLTIVGDWPCYGNIETLVCDNGKEFRGVNLRNAALHLGIDIQYCPPRQPWFKAVIERVFGTLERRSIANLPGVVFKMGVETDYDSQARACIDFNELDRIILKWIIDDYHQSPHSGLQGLTPRAAWDEAMGVAPVVLEFTEQQVEIFTGHTDTRTLTSGGIELDLLTYNNPALGQLRRHLGEDRQVLIKYSHKDLGRIWVRDEIANTYIPVGCQQKGYAAGLTWYMHQVYKKRARLKAKDAVDIEGLVTARDEIESYVKGLSTRDASEGGSVFARAAEGMGIVNPQQSNAAEVMPQQEPIRVADQPAPTQVRELSPPEASKDDIAAAAANW